MFCENNVYFAFCSLVELAELEIKHARTQQDLFRKALSGLQEVQ